jgi:hypothetical protein
VPDFDRIDAMPARDLAFLQQIVDRGRARAAVYRLPIAKRLAEMTAIRMRLET